MGYQESYFRMEKKKDFNILVDYIKLQGQDKFDMTIPVEIITLNKRIYTDFGHYNKGEKFIYVVGERYGQGGAERFFEYCENVPEKIIRDLEITCTEYFPSDDIFENNEITKVAIHEPFPWE